MDDRRHNQKPTMNDWGTYMGSGWNRNRWSANADKWICTMQGCDGRQANSGSNMVMYNWQDGEQVAVTSNASGSGWQAEAGCFWEGTVSSDPRISASPSSLSFSLVEGAANPAPQNVSVTNAGGETLANVTTARVVRKIDWHATYTNAVTSGIFGMYRVSLPITMADDRRALQVALRCCAMPQDAARLAFIRDTLTLDRLWVSPSLRQVVDEHPRLTLVNEVPFAFATGGNMVSPWSLT